MTQRTSAVTLLLAVFTLFVTSDSFANLATRLQQGNFNLFSSPSRANEIILQDVNGGHLSLSAYLGNVVILNFWKIDCPPCSKEKVILEKTYRKYRGRGLTVIAVNLFDPVERVRAYRNKGGFSFPLAVDPDMRFRIHQYTLASGALTACVVNSKQEAIYSIPAVPTTYLVNRSGQVVGSSFGMVNWEDQPFAELLETLLHEGSQPNAMAKGTDPFARVAGQGSKSAGPRAMPDSGTGSARAEIAIDHSSPRSATQLAQAAPLPFQPPQAPIPSVSPQPEVGGPKASPGTGQKKAGSGVQPAKPAPQMQRSKKQKPAQAAGVPSPYGTPQPYSSPTGGSPQAGQTARRPSPSTFPAIAPAPQAAAPATPSPAGTLAPLPPAIPYSGPAGRPQAPAPPVVPDAEGNVMARIPGENQSRWRGSQGSPQGTGELPPAQHTSSGNPIGGFILDAFGRPRAAGAQPVGVQQRAPETPPASVLGQLNQDISALGSGIRETFSRILPSRPSQ